MLTRLASAAVVLVVLCGCGVLEQYIGPRTVVAELEVFNRTEADIFYVAGDGERLDVPACGSASDPTFRIDEVRVRTEDGYIRSFGSAGSELAGQHVFVVEVARARDSGVPDLGRAPVQLPPCRGLPEVQVGN
jgi:hypothetical protein